MIESYFSSGPDPNLSKFGEEHARPYDPKMNAYNVPTFDMTIFINTKTTDMRIKLDTSRLRRRLDSKLDLLMGKVPKELKG